MTSKLRCFGISHQKIQNDTKGINIISAVLDGMGQYLHNMGDDMKYYADTLHQVDKHVKVSNMCFLSKNNIFTLTHLKLCKCVICASSYSYNSSSLIDKHPMLMLEQ